MRGHQGEGAKQGEMKGAVGAGERGPLFPRLHVNETEKAGPKAPPRNKMALYEQFTVPFHRFVQPSATPVYQQQYRSHELGYPYLPYYMRAGPYANTSHSVPVYAQPSHGTSSSVVTNGSGMVNEDSLRKLPRHHKVGKSSRCKVSRGLIEASADCIAVGPSKLKGKDANASAQSSLTSLIEVSANSVRDVSPDRERPTVPDVTESLQEALSTGEVGMECSTAVGQSCSFLTSASRAVAGQGSALAGSETLCTYGHMNAFKNSITDVEKVDDRVGSLSVVSLAKPDDEELKNIQNRTRHLECGTRKGDHSDDLVVPSASFDSMPIIKPRNVIHAIGQQKFWKARKTLLRQQQVFADQVFQLHKLIKVQQLLAETPGTLIDDKMHFKTIEECKVAAPLAKGGMNSGEDAHNFGVDFEEGSEDTSYEVGGQPKNKWEHTQAVGKVGLGASKLMPEFHSGGVSAWGYPSLGQWVGLMAAQGRPFGYQPFAGTLPPGSALQGSVSPMISLGIPYCDRRQEFPAEMGSSYGPPTVFKHDGSGTVSGNSSQVSNNLGGSWCNNSRRLMVHPASSGKYVPCGSGGSVSKSSASVQGVDTSCVPGLSYQWGLTGPSNTDSLKSYAFGSESSSPSIATRLKCQESDFTPSTSTANILGFSHPDVGGLAQNSDLGITYRSRSSDHYDNSKGAEEKEELNTSLLRCSKSQKVGARLSIDVRVSHTDEHSSDIDYSSLELFPLVPSLSSSGQNRKKAAEEGQGQLIRAVPRRAIAASESAAGILLSLQRERRK